MDSKADVNWRRRYFVGAAAFTAVAAPLGIIGSATAGSAIPRASDRRAPCVGLTGTAPS